MSESQRPWEDREKAVWAWCMCGSLSKVAEDTSIPRRTRVNLDLSAWPNVERWLGACTARPACAAARQK